MFRVAGRTRTLVGASNQQPSGVGTFYHASAVWPQGLPVLPVVGVVSYHRCRHRDTGNWALAGHPVQEASPSRRSRNSANAVSPAASAAAGSSARAIIMATSLAAASTMWANVFT